LAKEKEFAFKMRMATRGVVHFYSAATHDRGIGSWPLTALLVEKWTSKL
jgi:hypothetical protein